MAEVQMNTEVTDNNTSGSSKETKDENAASDKVENETAIVEPSDFTTKHPLQNRWTLWYDNPGKKTNQQSWGESLKKIVTFDTVEDFWRIFNNIRPASKLSERSNYHLFKDPIEPKWEHAENSNGGKWIVPIKGKELLDKLWLWAILACIGETFTDENEICGVVVSLRKGQDRISLWTKHGNNEQIQKSVGQQFKQILELPSSTIIGYQVHADSLKRNSSFNNRNRFEV